MATEIYNNLQPRIQAHLDERLESVSSVSNLPDPNVESNFIYEGAIVYVVDVKLNYQAQEDPNNPPQLAWVNIGGESESGKVQGFINVLPTTTILDCDDVSPDIDTCHSVLITVVGGDSVNIHSIENLPDDRGNNDLITFSTVPGTTITFVHTDYDAAGSNDIILEDGFNMSIEGRLIGDETLTLKAHDGAVCQWDATQFTKKSEISKTLLESFGVVNSLDSTSTTKALSALQGKILNDALATKQDELTAGSHLTINPSTDVIDSLPRTWSKESIPITEADDPLVILTTTVLTTEDKYRTADFRSLNKGLWMLPPNFDPTLPNSWYELDSNDDGLIKTARHLISPDTIIAGVGGVFIPRIMPLDYHGDDFAFQYNADGPATAKVSFTLPAGGTYRVRSKVNLVVSAGTHDKLTYNMYLTNGLSTAAAGIPGTAALQDLYTVVDADGNASYETEALVIVDTAGVGDGIMLELATSSDYTGVAFNSTLSGYIDITKLK